MKGPLLGASHKKVITWLENRGFDVQIEPGGDDSVCFDSGVVRVNSRTNTTSQLCTLLHEAGHVLVRASRKGGKRVASLTEGGDKSFTLRQRLVAIIHEEFEAWERGERLAKRLNVKLPRAHYRRMGARCAMTYVRAATLVVSPRKRRPSR